MTAQEVIEMQVKFSFGKISRHLTSTYMQLMLAFEATEIVQQLKMLLLDRTEIYWPAILTFTATFLVCFTESPALMQGD